MRHGILMLLLLFFQRAYCWDLKQNTANILLFSTNQNADILYFSIELLLEASERKTFESVYYTALSNFVQIFQG